MTYMVLLLGIKSRPMEMMDMERLVEYVVEVQKNSHMNDRGFKIYRRGLSY